MLQSLKDQQAEATIISAIRGMFGDAIERIDVSPVEDHRSEPALAVTVYLKAARKRMPSSLLLDTIATANTALQEIEDYRFPYVTFLAPDDEHAEDTRPAA